MENYIEELIETAINAMEFAYSPYSNFKVGSALLGKDGAVYSGCNIENASYSPTNCAERTAIFKAVSYGKKDFSAICVVGGQNGVLENFCPPCGVCLQVMAEFCDLQNFEVILAKSKEEYVVYKLKELLPLAFEKDNLENY